MVSHVCFFANFAVVSATSAVKGFTAKVRKEREEGPSLQALANLPTVVPGARA
jgi:hypothetical protein